MRFLALAAACLIVSTACSQQPAQQPSQQPAQQSAQPSAAQLRFTLILSRHGIRGPLAVVESLDRVASSPWPTWEVPRGHLTPHGAQDLNLMGAFMRQQLATAGLVPTTGCPNPADLYLYADTDERNIASTRATFSGFAPNCPALPVFTFAGSFSSLPAVRDPFFLPFSGTFLAPIFKGPVKQMKKALPISPESALNANDTPEHRQALELVAHVLAPDPAHPAAHPILDEKVELITNPLGDPIVYSHGPLPTASTLIEDFLLEFVDNKPMSEVAWGRIDEPTLRRLLPLHTLAFGYTHRTPWFARAESSNALAHILDTLDQAAQGKAVRGALGPAGKKLVYISGHDTNLVGVASLLNLHWTVDGDTDDTPPDSQLVFELWQRPGASDFSIHIYFRAQTIDQLRNATPLSAEAPPARADLTPPGCKSAQGCAYTAFRAEAAKNLNTRYVKPDLDATHIAP